MGPAGAAMIFAGKITAASLSKTKTASSSDTTDTSTYSIASISIGTASSDRLVVVAFGAHFAGVTAPSISSVTIAGSAATIDKSLVASGGTDGQITAICSRLVTTGTTMTLAVNFSHTARHLWYAVWSVTGSAAAAASSTVSDTVDTLALTLNCPAGGAIFACCAQQLGSTTTWTNLTEDQDDTVETNFQYSAASDVFATAQTSLAVVADSADTAIDIMGGVAVSYGP